MGPVVHNADLEGGIELVGRTRDHRRWKEDCGDTRNPTCSVMRRLDAATRLPTVDKEQEMKFSNRKSEDRIQTLTVFEADCRRKTRAEQQISFADGCWRRTGAHPRFGRVENSELHRARRQGLGRGGKKANFAIKPYHIMSGPSVSVAR